MDQSLPAQYLFDWADYVAFGFMLFSCIIIGIYFGFIRVSKNVSDYLVGGRSMSIFPIAVSLVVSNISAILYLGLPSDVYIYGNHYMYMVFSLVTMGIVAVKIVLPVFMELKIMSTYEYLEYRFNQSIRRLGSILFAISMMLWFPLLAYVPCLAFNQATGISIYISIPVVCSICIFYTCIGGIKAVVWTDFLQAVMMFGCLSYIIIRGTSNAGGLSVVIEKNLESGRLELPIFDFNPLLRITFWSTFLAGGFNALDSSLLGQVMMQRYVSLPSIKAAQIAVTAYCFIKSLFYIMIGYTGFLIYTKYFDCDPITTKMVKAEDQLLPFLAMETLGHIPGFPGLFLSGVFSASLSSFSSGLNSLAAVILEDFYKPWCKKEVSERHAQIILKLSVILVGILTIILAFGVEKLGPVLQLSISLSSIASGPMLGIFFMGFLMPWTNGKGAIYGSFISIIMMSWLNFNAHKAAATGALVYPRKPTSVEGCPFNVTLPLPSPTSLLQDIDEIFVVYRISFMWYTTCGMCLTLFFGGIISYLAGGNKNKKIDRKLFAPFIRKWLPSSSNDNKTKEELGLIAVLNNQN